MSKSNASVIQAGQMLKEACDMGRFTLSEMAQAMELPTSTVDRYLASLMELGFIEKSKGTYEPGLALARLWNRYRAAQMRIIEEATAKRSKTEDHTIAAESKPAEVIEVHEGEWQ